MTSSHTKSAPLLCRYCQQDTRGTYVLVDDLPAHRSCAVTLGAPITSERDFVTRNGRIELLSDEPR